MPSIFETIKRNKEVEEIQRRKSIFKPQKSLETPPQGSSIFSPQKETEKVQTKVQTGKSIFSSKATSATPTKQEDVQGWWKRKSMLGAKTLGDIVGAPFGGTKGLVEKFKQQREDLPSAFPQKMVQEKQARELQYPKLLTEREAMDKFRGRLSKEILSVKPKTPTEHGLSAAVQYSTFSKAFQPLSQVFGLGKKGIGLTSKILRGAGVGATIGAIQTGTPEERAQRALMSGTTFGVLTGGGAVLMDRLAKYSTKHLTSVLNKAGMISSQIETGIKTKGGYSQAKAYQELMSGLNPMERNTVMNIIRGKHGMSQKQWRNWYQKKIGDPAYGKVIDFLDKHTPPWVKEKLVYRTGSPEHLSDLYEQRQVNLGRWNDLAGRTGKLMTEGVTEAESKIMLRALREPLQLELLKTARPDLAGKILQARSAIDETSRELAEQLMRKAGITDRAIIEKNILGIKQTVEDNIGSYVKRVYQMPEGKTRWFLGKRGVKEPRIYEKAKIARQIYEKGLNKKIDSATRELEKAGKIIHTKDSGIGGIGKVTEKRLNLRGVKTVEDVANMSSDDLTNVLLLEERSSLDNMSRQAVSALNRIDNELEFMTKTGRKFSERSRFTQLLNGKDKVIKILKERSSKRYNNAFARAEGMKLDAAKNAAKRRGLIGKINEYKNLIEKPQKDPDLPYELQKKLQVVETGGFPVARSIQDAGYKIEGSRFFNDIATNPAYSTTNPQQGAYKGWKQLADNDSYGSLRNMWVHPQVGKDINAIQRILQEEDKAYIHLLSMWKAGKVTLNPATHGRNIISNTVLMEMSGVPSHRIPDLLSASVDDIVNQTEFYKDLKKIGLGSGTFTKVEIEALSNVYKGQKGFNKYLLKAKDSLKPFKSLNDLYQAEEELFKIAKVRYMLEQGFTKPNALKEAQKWLFNYNQITDFVKTVKQHPLGSPFITFQYKMAPRVMEALVKNPLSVVKYPLLFKGMEQYAIKKFGLSDMDVEIIKKDRPLTYILPFTDQHGQLRLYDLQYTLPYGAAIDVGEKGPFRAFGIGGNPIVSTFYNVGLSFNKDPYTGADIISTNAGPYKAFKDTVNQFANQLLPPLTPYVGYSAKSIGKAIQGTPLTKYGERPDYVLELLGNIAGLKTTPTTVPTAYQRLFKHLGYVKMEAQKESSRILDDQRLNSEQVTEKYKENYLNYIQKRTQLIKPFLKERK